MNPGNPEALDQRLLLLTPTARDGQMTRGILQRAGVASQACTDLTEALWQLGRGAAGLLIAEEALARDTHGRLAAWIAAQEPWSDLPVMVLARPGLDSEVLVRAVNTLSNLTVLERPTRVSSLVSAARAAIRSRARQYQLREHLLEQQRSQAALRESDRRKDEFLAILAHELRNPLAPIRSALSVFQRDEVAPSRRRLLDILERQVDTMVRLVDDLLEVSRVARGVIELRTEPVDLVAVVRGAIETSQPLITAAAHHLWLDLPAAPLRVEGDALRLTQVIANIVNNAAKYTPRAGELHVSLHADGGDAVIAVQDNGIGIAPDMLARVFEPFLQLRQAPRLAQGGLGIGLTLVKRLVELHGGGRVSAHSDGPGQGSRFEVRLPLLAPRAEAAATKRCDPATAAPFRGRLLIADDNRDAADALALLVGLLGVRCEVAYGGEAALAAIERDPPDLALIDIGMPDVDGYAVAQAVREEPRWRHVRLVALTGWGRDHDRQRSGRAGFEQHMVKPVSLDALRRLLRMD